MKETHRFRVSTERHIIQWRKILGTEPVMGIITLTHAEYQQYHAAIDAIRPPVIEWRPPGRPVGSMGKKNRKKSTITLHKEDWDKLDDIGPSRGLAVEKLLDDKDK